MRRLSPVELATLTVHYDPARPWRKGPDPTLACQVARFVRAWTDRRGGAAEWRGERLARELMRFFTPARREPLPWSGLDLLRVLDAESTMHGVEVRLAAEPTTEAWRAFRPMRLSERLAELGWTE